MSSPTGDSSSLLDIQNNFNELSLRDLVAARDLYHLHLLAKQHVVGTAVGRYLIRSDDPWPQSHRDLILHDSRAARDARLARGTRPPRTLANSEVRPYSWPCVIALVDEWVEGPDLHPEDLVPSTLHMPDGSRVPVCVVLAPREEQAPPPVMPGHFAGRFMGGGYPVLVDVQGRQHFASIGCLATDGHTTYALTNRHVAGEPGEPVYALLGGGRVRIGESAPLQLQRQIFSRVYDGFAGDRTYLHLDVGLIRLDDLRRWTAQVYGIGTLDEVADLGADNFSLRLVGSCVRAHGAASGPMRGMILGLFFRHRSLGGFDEVSDFLIGPRDDRTPLDTHPGDSGTVWVLDVHDQPNIPIALQWGGQRFRPRPDKPGSPYALATCLSTACRLLDVDVVRDWNVGIPEYWGAVGHYTIATKAIEYVKTPALRALLERNLDRISYPLAEITSTTGRGLSGKGARQRPFCPLADVPDMVWKLAPAGIRRGKEKPNHFADMDKRDGQGRTLLDRCKSVKSLDPAVWKTYYADPAVKDASKGILPFRVWQYFQELAGFARQRDAKSFVCAAGTLAHYVGDACQPLHISYMFNGDPADGGASEGVHAAYEDVMVNHKVTEIQAGLASAKPKRPADAKRGRDAAAAIVALMRATFANTPPADLCRAFVKAGAGGASAPAMADALWAEFGAATVRNMALGAATLAMIWESAWVAGGGAKAATGKEQAFEPKDLQAIYERLTFVPSHNLDGIGALLKP